MAWPFLSKLGFEPVTDPCETRNAYRLTSATYKSKRGLFLQIGFDPIDSNSAMINCGRQWRAKAGGFLLSNRYSVLAKRFGIDVPEYYTLRYGDEPVRTMERILDDLRRTLVAVMERTTREDLIAIENEESGACQHAAAHAGTEYLEAFEIVDY